MTSPAFINKLSFTLTCQALRGFESDQEDRQVKQKLCARSKFQRRQTNTEPEQTSSLRERSVSFSVTTAMNEIFISGQNRQGAKSRHESAGGVRAGVTALQRQVRAGRSPCSGGAAGSPCRRPSGAAGGRRGHSTFWSHTSGPGRLPAGRDVSDESFSRRHGGGGRRHRQPRGRIPAAPRPPRG